MTHNYPGTAVELTISVINFPVGTLISVVVLGVGLIALLIFGPGGADSVWLGYFIYSTGGVIYIASWYWAGRVLDVWFGLGGVTAKPLTPPELKLIIWRSLTLPVLGVFLLLALGYRTYWHGGILWIVIGSWWLLIASIRALRIWRMRPALTQVPPAAPS